METLPEWMRPPRPEGWYAEDLDNLPEAPRHTELLDGVLVFMMSPQLNWHTRVARRLANALELQAPDGTESVTEMTVILHDKTRPEPDMMVVWSDGEPTGAFRAEQVLLAVEVVSPESAHRDRTIKFRSYEAAAIPHYWIVENEQGAPVVHVYEYDQATKAYVAVGIFREKLTRTVPFDISVDVEALARVKPA